MRRSIAVLFLLGLELCGALRVSPSLLKHARRLVRSASTARSASPAAAGGTDATSSGDVGAIPDLLASSRSSTEAMMRVAAPSIAIGLLRTALGQVDAYYIGRLGVLELEAIGAASFAVWLVYIVGELGSVGVHALASEAEGASNRPGVGEAVSRGLWFSVFTSAIVGVGLGATGGVDAYCRSVGSLAKQPKVLDLASKYLGATAYWGLLPLSTSAVAAAGFKGIGQTRPALVIAAFAAALNAVLDPIFLRRYGIAGAAYATNLCAALGTVATLVALEKHGVHVPLGVKWGKKQFKSMLASFRKIASIGAPVASSGAMFSIIYVILSRTLAKIDPTSLASLGLGHRIEATAFLVNEGFAVGTATVVGQWFGLARTLPERSDARKAAVKQAVDAARGAAGVAALVMLPIAVATLIFAESAASIFTDDKTVIAHTASYLRIVGVTFPLLGVEAVYDGALTGAQHTLPTFLIGLAINLTRIPLAQYLAPRLGVSGVWIAISISAIFKAPAKYLAFRQFLNSKHSPNYSPPPKEA